MTMATARELLPVLTIEVTGNVLSSNLDVFRGTALAAIRAVNTTLTADADFVEAELSVKWCREVELRIEDAKVRALSQTATIDELFRALDAIADESRRVRIDLEKMVKIRKDEIKGSIVESARAAFALHVATLNAEIAPYRFQVVIPDFAGEIKGKRSIDAMEGALDAALASGKIAADAAAAVVRGNIQIYLRTPGGLEFLLLTLRSTSRNRLTISPSWWPAESSGTRPQKRHEPQ